MDAQERLRHLIDEHESRLRDGVPPDRQAALLALLRAIDRPRASEDPETTLDIIIGRHEGRLGSNLALWLCLAGGAGGRPDDRWTGDSLAAWAGQLLVECGRVAVAERVLWHVETGFMRIVGDEDGSSSAWIASGRAPASWRERVDFDWWSRWIADRPELMDHQMGYPDDSVIGGCSTRTYRDVAAFLHTRANAASETGEAPITETEAALVASIVETLSLPPEQVGLAISAMTFDEANAAYHAAVPGIAPAPLVRIAPGRLAISAYGLTAEPLLFVMRELRRRDAQAYHNTAWMREAVFRRDLYTLFSDKRFVTSATRMQLRRERGGLRTDVDAAVYDRKTGTLGVFELKSQDPFARSAAGLTRQRDNVLHANHQIAGILDWLNRNGADELLNRMDRETAKRFRVRKVLPFVLGRYLVHFPDGPAPDKRAAWATWPQVLRTTGGRPFGGKDANPLATLSTRLRSETPLAMPSSALTTHELALGGARLTIYPSFGAYKESRSG